MSLSTSNSESFRSYSVKMLSAAASILLLVGVFNWLVNPLLRFTSPSIEGFNTYKTQFFQNLHTIVPYWARSATPDTLILGSSRAGNGLDPAHPGFRNANVFNYAIPGVRIETIGTIYAEMSKSTELESVLLTLDFFSFNVMPSLVEIRDADMVSRFLQSTEGGYNWNAHWLQIQDQITGLISWQSTVNSYLTIRAQSAIADGTAGTIDFYRDGHWRQTLPANGNQLQHIRTIERQYMSNRWFPDPSKQFRFSNAGRASFDSYRDLLRQMHADGVDANLVISPLHARFQSALTLVGLDDEFQIWKRQLSAINMRVAEELQEAPFSLWDFADFGSLNQEAIPTTNAAIERMWTYLDGQHYTAELGNYLLDRILDYRHPDRGDAKDFGTLLTGENIDSHLQQVDFRQQAYSNNHPGDMQDLRNSFASIQRTNSDRGNAQ